MSKVELAKLLGLEVSCMYDESVFADNIKTYDVETDAEFKVGNRYFKVFGKTPEECWENAASKFLKDLAIMATVRYDDCTSMWR